ncbi:MAG: LysR family transcriptional regulator [Dermatophilaceae bacterium]
MKADETEHLRLLSLIQDHGSLAGAADVLGITAPAATQRLAKAESVWGTRLVDRGPRGARLTTDGEVLAAYGRRIDRQAREALTEFRLRREGTRRRLRLGAFQQAALHLLPPAMTALRHRVGDADLSVLDIQSVDAVRLVAEGDLDLALMATWDNAPVADPRVRVTRLAADPIVVILPDDHPLARRGPSPVALPELSDEAWVVIRGRVHARAQFDRSTAAAGFAPRVRFESDSYDVAQALVATGYGVALVSRMTLRHWPGATWRPLVRPRLRQTIHIVRPVEDTRAPLAATFAGLLRDVARDLAD